MELVFFSKALPVLAENNRNNDTCKICRYLFLLIIFKVQLHLLKAKKMPFSI